jgi:anthranilate phosphoribosyltransferase
MKKHLDILRGGNNLSEKEMMEAMAIIMDGRAIREELEEFLSLLATKGETIDEITGAARVLRKRALSIEAPTDAVDCCGTGGDQSYTYNISTAVALIAAACGVKVAKHGNRASSSKCGAADVLEALGVNLSITPEAQIEALKRFHFVFMHASRHHPAMKHVAVTRKKLGHPTIFNLLGPLANPAGAKFQLIGVYDKKWILPMAEVLKNLRSTRAWVVHGEGGLDEISLSGPTHIAILDDGKINEKILNPDDFGLPVSSIDKIKGGDINTNATALRALLEGQKCAYRDIVLANAAAVLMVKGKTDDLKKGARQAASAIDDGAALQTLKDYITFSRQNATPETTA